MGYGLLSRCIQVGVEGWEIKFSFDYIGCCTGCVSIAHGGGWVCYVVSGLVSYGASRHPLIGWPSSSCFTHLAG